MPASLYDPLSMRKEAKKKSVEKESKQLFPLPQGNIHDLNHVGTVGSVLATRKNFVSKRTRSS